MPRLTFYTNDETLKMLNDCENRSKVITEAINTYFLNKEVYVKKEEQIEQKIKELEAQMEKEKIELTRVRKKIRDIEKKDNSRPKDYMKAVGTLKILPDVRKEDIKFQDKRLNVSVKQLETWLSEDGYMEEIFSKDKKNIF